MYDNPLAARRAPICSICNLPVLLNNAKTDEDGSAVHEDCYLIKLGVAKPVKRYPKVSSVDLVNIGERKQRCLRVFARVVAHWVTQVYCF
jgi:hypothetical protein